ncbi:hypothetical protein GQ457_01G012670 [Hibiscus cannabinus]
MIVFPTTNVDSGKSRPAEWMLLSSSMIIHVFRSGGSYVGDHCSSKRLLDAMMLRTFDGVFMPFPYILGFPAMVMVRFCTKLLMTRPPSSDEGGACLRMELSQVQRYRCVPWSRYRR